MRFLSLCATAISLGYVRAYLNTSPLFMWSNKDLSIESQSLESASTLTSSISQYLSKCPSSFYVLISQPGVNTADYRSSKPMPSLAKHLSSKSDTTDRTKLIVSEVAGQVDTASWQYILQSNCDVKVVKVDAQTGSLPTSFDASPRLLKLSLPAPVDGDRAKTLAHNDALFASMMALIPSKDHTVIYTTSPDVAAHSQHAEMQDSFHMDLKRDLKRDLTFHATAKDNQTMVDGPLFDKYQFFTPGIWMGFLTGFLLLMILYVGVNALSSLQVTYGAFDKEMGQLAGKKQQ